MEEDILKINSYLDHPGMMVAVDQIGEEIIVAAVEEEVIAAVEIEKTEVSIVDEVDIVVDLMIEVIEVEDSTVVEIEEDLMVIEGDTAVVVVVDSEARINNLNVEVDGMEELDIVVVDSVVIMLLQVVLQGTSLSMHLLVPLVVVVEGDTNKVTIPAVVEVMVVG